MNSARVVPGLIRCADDRKRIEEYLSREIQAKRKQIDAHTVVEETHGVLFHKLSAQVVTLKCLYLDFLGTPYREKS